MSKNTNAVSYAGFWWLPEDPTRRVAGFLSFTPGENIKVTCTELLRPIPPAVGKVDITHKQGEYEVVLGRVDIDGKSQNVTLVGVSYVHLTIPSNFEAFNQKDELDVTWLLVGEHFSDKASVRFNELEMHFAHLTRWVGYAPFTFTDERGKDDRVVGASYGYRFPEAEKYNIDALEATLSFSDLFSEESKPRTAVNLSHTTPATLVKSEVADLETFLAAAYDLQVLLALLMNQMPRTMKYRGRHVRRDDAGKALEVLSSCDIYFRTKHAWGSEASQDDKAKLLSSFADLKESLPKVVNRWFGNVDRYREAAELFYDNLAAANRFSPLRFLTTAQAVETAHRRLFGDNTFTKEEKQAYKALRKSFDEALDKVGEIEEHHKADLREKLHHLPDTMLKNRLAELWAGAEGVVRAIIPDEPTFNRDTRNSRNYYTHYTESLKDKAANGWDLAKLTVQLEALLSATFLLELGVGDDVVRRLFVKHYAWLSQLPAQRR